MIKRKLKQCIDCEEGQLSYLEGNGRCQYHNRLYRASLKTKTTNENDVPALEKKLDGLVSQYVRLWWARADGMVQCYTSGKWMRWQDAQCGHCFNRWRGSVRWDLDNLRPQSKHDNEVLGGNIEVFKAKLEQELGDKRWQELKVRAYMVQKKDRLWMQEQIRWFTEEVYSLKEKLKNNE